MKVTAQPARICRMGLRQTCAKTTSRSAIRSSRHLEGANITAVSSKAAPVHMDSDTTIEVFIPAFWPVRIVAPRRALHRMTGLGIDLIMDIQEAIARLMRMGVNERPRWTPSDFRKSIGYHAYRRED